MLETPDWPMSYDSWTLDDDRARVAGEVSLLRHADDDLPKTHRAYEQALDRFIVIASYRVHDLRGTV